MKLPQSQASQKSLEVFEVGEKKNLSPLGAFSTDLKLALIPTPHLYPEYATGTKKSIRR